MRHAMRALLAAAVIVAVFLAGRFTAMPPESAGRLAPGAEVASTRVEGTHQTQGAVRGISETAALPASSYSASAVRAAHSASPAAATDAAASGGPQPLRADDLPRFAEAEGFIRANGGAARDLLELSEREEQDDGAPRLEQRIAQAIRAHGNRHTALRLSQPHCTRSVCILRGIGAGNAQDPASDWQGLSLNIVNQPWWREAFDDMHTLVSGNAGETIYLTFYVRCEPAACRHRRR